MDMNVYEYAELLERHNLNGDGSKGPKKPRKSKGSRVPRVFKRFLFLLLVFFILVGAGHLYRFIRNHGKSAEKVFPVGVEVEEFEKYMERKRDTASDIKGMSQYDKYKMGLNYKDGSDSDYDGLTDKEEIEVYKTDPLKASTAGDLYTDGYKVQHDLPLFSICEYKKEIKFIGNKCSEIKLEADEPSDLNAVVEDYTKRYSLEYYGIEKIYKGFWLYNYTGAVKMDLSSVLKRNKVDYDDVSVWVVKGAFLVSGLSELEACDFTISDDLGIKSSDKSKVKEKSHDSIRMKEKIISFLFPWFEYDPKAGPSIFNYFYS